MRSVLALADATTVPSGYLYRQAPARSPLRDLDGSEDSPAITQDQWDDALECLADAALDPGASPMSDVADRAEAHRSRGHVPIFVADYEYSAIRKRVWLAIERQAGRGADASLPDSQPEHVFVESRAFFACALLAREYGPFTVFPAVHRGRTITFILPADGMLGVGAAPRSVVADFGDGQAARPITLDQPVEVTYDSPGEKIVALAFSGTDGDRTAYFRLSIEDDELASAAFPYSTIYLGYADANKLVPGSDGMAEATVFQRRGKGKITKPVVIAEGFPFDYEWLRLLRYANSSDFAADLIARDYDVVLVRFPRQDRRRTPLPPPEPPRRIQDNAYAFIVMLQEIIRRREGSEQLLVGGFSTGGLIARFALTYMEKTGRLDHQTRAFFTVDTPHEGANVPVCIQGMLRLRRPATDERRVQLESPAAQQMMLQWLPPEPWQDHQVFGPSGLRETFVAELVSIGSMPKKIPTMIAIACGEGVPRENETPPGRLAADFNCLGPGGEMGFLYSWPRDNADRREVMMTSFSLIRKHYLFAQPKGNGIDSAPGGVWEKPIFEEFVANVPLPDHMKKAYYKNACFIPTASALAIPVTNYFAQLNLDSSKFNRVTHSHEGNLPHVHLTPTLVEFLRKFMAP
ncbi:MAG TPA: hypothetical protein VFS60_01565 [Thermoanaerobaculia bacterium]|nr:hypothetical protein [Thermoanaerobaculia bacterium]